MLFRSPQNPKTPKWIVLSQIVENCFDLSDPAIDGPGLEFLEIPGASWLNQLELSASGFYDTVSRLEDDGAFVFSILVVFDLAIAVEFKCSLLAHVQPVYFAHLSEIDWVVTFLAFLLFPSGFINLQEGWWEVL